jgi:glycosyltransferase involved in cell wall biosynthesis
MKNQERPNQPHSILFISALDFWSMGNGKGGPALWQTLIGYAKHGWKVYFITGNYAQEESLKAPDNINVLRFDAPWLKRLIKIKKIGFFAKIIWWSWFQILAFIKALQIYHQNNIDIVYGYEIYGIPVAKLLSKIWKVPVISRFQGTILGVAWMKKKLWKLRAWNHVLAFKIPTDFIIMTNDGTQGDIVLKQLGVSSKRLKFWMNGVDWEHFKKIDSQEVAKKGLKIEAKYVLLTVSRLVSWKCVERSINAISGLVNNFYNTQLIIVGDGPERKKLVQLRDKLGIRKNVRFEGAVSHNKVPKYLAAADIFLSFYDWSNVGNPLLEAMMAGKCIVTLNNGDTGRFIQNGYNGVLL